MILTRVKLDMEKRQTLKAMANPNVFHGVIERCQSGERNRLLWRLDHLHSTYYLLILSCRPLDQQKLADEFCCDFQDVEWRDYQPLLDRITPGSRWRFRLVANPTISIRSKDGQIRGKVVSPVHEEDQRKWLESKAEKQGFELDKPVFIKGAKWLSIKKGSQRKRVTLQEVTFEGVLTVKDPEIFKETLISGFGRGKAYGMGLMTLVSYAG